MTYELLEFLGSIILLICLIKASAEQDKNKALGVFIIIGLFVADLSIPNSWNGWLTEGSRMFVYKSFYELALVALLHMRPCKETVLVMGLSLLAVTINMLSFSFYAQGIDPDWFLNPLSMAVFYVMLAILLSKRLSNGIYGYITSVSFVRYYCNDYLKINSEGK